MVRVTLYIKKKVQEKEGSYSIQRIKKDTIDIDRPKTYKEFDKEISTKFNIIGKDYAIKVLLPSNDEENIKDEDSYNDDDNKKSSQFIVILDEEDSDENDPDKEINNDLDIDSILDIKKELIIDENELDEILEEQIISKINNKEKKLEEEEEEENVINIVNNKLIDKFLADFKKEINSETENKKKSFINSIKKDFSNFENILDDKINAFNKNLQDNINESEDVKKKMSEMKNYISFVVPDQNLPIMFDISCDKKDYEIPENEAHDFKIPEIKIQNILNKKVNFKNKYWIRDEKSNPDIVLPIEKNDIDISEELGINESKYYSVKVSINNPKNDQKYFLKFYIGDNTLNSSEYQNVTKEPLFLNIKIKEKEEEEVFEKKLNDEVEKKEDDMKPEKKNEEEIKNDIVEEVKNVENKKEEEEPIKIEEKKVEVENPNVNDKKPIVNIQEDNDGKKDDDNKKDDNNNNNKGTITDDEVNQIYDEFEDELYVSSFIGEDEMKKIIRDKGGVREEIKKELDKLM